ncbi:MAG TPA: GNAT family N-acetyltransferase [Candidatus Lokiarchaeia archaeon]|nr:GNAT family N-acetyltransferase [Candidatus Lokiarchaeia archaeon]
MPPISYRRTDETELDLIQSLWVQLRAHHEQNSRYFKRRYKQMTWEGRKASLVAKVVAGARMQVVLAENNDDGGLIGYCINSVEISSDPVFIGNNRTTGEIDSIFVLEERRGEGIGDALMKIAIEWLDENHVASKKVVVADGNETAWTFYQRYGFYPKFHTLEQVAPEIE